MKEAILKVLDSYSSSQPNLESSAAREKIAEEILQEINKPSRSQQQVNFSNDKTQWICEYCGENTWDVYNLYMGTGTNHLECELANS